MTCPAVTIAQFSFDPGLSAALTGGPQADAGIVRLIGAIAAGYRTSHIRDRTYRSVNRPRRNPTGTLQCRPSWFVNTSRQVCTRLAGHLKQIDETTGLNVVGPRQPGRCPWVDNCVWVQQLAYLVHGSAAQRCQDP